MLHEEGILSIYSDEKIIKNLANVVREQNTATAVSWVLAKRAPWK